MPNAKTFQGLIQTLVGYWEKQGCVVMQAYDLPVGAATFHPATFLRSLGPDPWRCVYTQGCRRPGDGRYGTNPNRLQHYYQLQVMLKPSPANMQELYLASLETAGFDRLCEDIRFVKDDWESPTLGATGYGWEVWINGMEVSQYTYFQKVGGIECRPVSGEISYGIERLSMLIQDKKNIYELDWGTGLNGKMLTYGEVFQRNEREQSAYNFEYANTKDLRDSFDQYEKTCSLLIEKELVLPAYEQTMLASHAFNLLDSRHAISVTERQQYVLRTRSMASSVAKLYDRINRETLS